MQVRGDPLAIVEHRRPLLLGAGLGQLERDRGLVGEPGGHVHVVGGEPGPAAQPGRGEHPVHPLRTPQRQHQHRADVARPRTPSTTSPGSSLGWATRSGSPVENARPASDPATGTARPHSPPRPAPTATSTRSCPRAAAGSTTVTRSAWAISRAAFGDQAQRTVVLAGLRGRPDSSRRVIAAVACSHSPRARAA